MAVRPVAENLHQALMCDEWPRAAAIVDFGLDSQEHYEALYYPVRKGEITLQKLDEILGDGPKITACVQACKHNPHKNIVFKTAYDDMTEDDDDS